MSEFKYSLCLLTSGVLWGIIPIFSKDLTAAGFSPFQIGFTRVFFSAVILGTWLAIRSPSRLIIRPKDSWCFMGTGIFSIMLFNYCYFRTIEAANIALAALLLYTAPIFVLLFSVLLFKERVTARKLLAVTCAVTGCACITGIFSRGMPSVPLPVFLVGLGAGLFYSLYTIFGKFALARYSSMTVTVYSFIFATIGTAFLVPLQETFALYTDPHILLSVCGIVLLSSVGSFSLYTLGLTRVAPSKAIILATIEPVVAILVGILVFHEHAGAATFAGMTLIIGATVILSGER